MSSTPPQIDPPDQPPRIAPPWGIIGVLAGVAALFAVMLGALMLSALWIHYKAGFSADEEALRLAAEQIQSNPVALFIFVAVQFGAFIAIPLLIAARSRGGLSALGLRTLSRRAVLECAGGALCLLSVSLAYGPVLRWMAPEYAEQFTEEVKRQTEQLQSLGMPFFLLVAIVVAPIAEELFFRSLVFGGLRSTLSFHAASISAALFFGLIHFMPASLPPLVMVGLVCAWFYERHRSILSAILVHAFFNGMTIVLGLAAS